jgi:hypothetical protein
VHCVACWRLAVRCVIGSCTPHDGCNCSSGSCSSPHVLTLLRNCCTSAGVALQPRCWRPVADLSLSRWMYRAPLLSAAGWADWWPPCCRHNLHSKGSPKTACYSAPECAACMMPVLPCWVLQQLLMQPTTCMGDMRNLVHSSACRAVQSWNSCPLEKSRDIRTTAAVHVTDLPGSPQCQLFSMLAA